jgi:hypothetical protein
LAVEQAGFLEDTVDAGRAASDDILIDHHESQAAITLQREQCMEIANGLFLLVFKPMVTRNPGIVFVGLAVALLPGVPLGGGQTQPQQEAGDRNAGLIGPSVDEIDDLVADVRGNPESL